MTMTLISTTTVGAGGAASIDFTSIVGTYTDLLFQVNVRSNATGRTNEDLMVKINNASTNLSFRLLQGYGSGVQSQSGSSGRFINTNAAGATANTFGSHSLYIPNYAGSTNKSISVDSVTENNATEAYQEILAGLWANTAAINQVTFTPAFGTLLVQYSTISLYGILKGSGGATVS